MITSAIEPATVRLVVHFLNKTRQSLWYEMLKECWRQTRRPKLKYEYETPLRISKPYNSESESESENSLRKGKNQVKLSFIYLSGPNISQLQF